ncbi:MAG: methyltransferase domain-containing protein [Okeania sp. SIO2C9]|uniref:methyltransferase domain-containing protein n=1 Tax=Okeania sp. SIO2C9 TaxID=2607791 RepID=UPI0013BF848E|nr:methyltransferase domain-containing protein [Okeania sp. SIO2C9]NEQ78567.1 methyltransferase domain-containing protein [Okeania sp. SIO2C9]
MNELRIDLGCGSSKKEGTIGIDQQGISGVDYVLDIQTQPLPFLNQSVGYVHSSHFLEHIENPIYIFQEISRVCRDGAELEFWTPYTWSNSAFVFGHKSFLNEDHYLHMCVWHPDFWAQALKARWLLKEITYIIEPKALIDIYRNKISLDFALNYYKNIVRELVYLLKYVLTIKVTLCSP